MNTYRANKLAAIYVNIDKETGEVIPTLTQQDQAHDANINVIVGRFLKTGTGATSPGVPITGDFSDLPTDLRGFIKRARSLEELKETLPDQVRGLTTEELLALTPEQLANKLTPPEPPAKPKDQA